MNKPITSEFLLKIAEEGDEFYSIVKNGSVAKIHLTNNGWALIVNDTLVDVEVKYEHQLLSLLKVFGLDS